MKRIARTILAQPPKRRRRMWKYVSPRRRRVGLLVLALLVTILYAGWYFTRSSNIRREAKRALEDLTGADVDVDDASFSVFEGIRLFHVRVRIRGEAEPFFTAEELVLKHNPGTLLLKHRIEPTEIVCLRPVVNLEYEEGGESNAERLFRLASSNKRSSGDGEPMPLPHIWLRDGLLNTRVFQKGPNGTIVKELAPQQLKASLTPKDSHLYDVAVQDLRRNGKMIPHVRFQLNTLTGKIRLISGSVTEQWAMHMPPEYRKWIDRYSFRGDFSLLEGEGTDPEKGLYEIELNDFSMKLPESEGDLTLRDVRGKLRFTKKYVEMEDITGRVIEAGKAVFTLNGRYDGYAKDSPFQIKVDVENLSFPEKIRGPLKKTVDIIRREFKPRGVGSVSMTFRRDPDGTNICDGTLSPQHAKMIFRFFPLPAEDVTGSVHFTQAGPDRVALTAKRGKATFIINGDLSRDPEYHKLLFDVRVSGKDVVLDAATRKALPEKYHKVWDKLSPTGTCDVDVQVVKDKPLEKAALNVDFHMKGFTGITFDAFPYPLKNISGEVTLRGKDIDLLWARSRTGQMLLHAKGGVKGLMTEDMKITLNLQATRVPLDATLLGAVKGQTRVWLEELQPGGEIGRVSARISKQGKNRTEFDINAVLKDASFCYKKFPFPVTHAVGEIEITPHQAIFHDIRGRHKDGKVTISGTVDLQKTESKKQSYDLSIQADDVTLGKEFHNALPPKLRRVWASLSPTGKADIDVALRSLGNENPPDYRVTVDAKDATLRYQDFPYTFKNVKGKAIVTPGAVRIEKMHTSNGEMQAEVTGLILHKPDGEQDVVLQVSAKDVPIDKDLLGAVPAEVVPLVKRFQPGGKLNTEIQTLHIHRPAQPATQPAGAAATPPPPTWDAEGSVALRDVMMDLGFGPRTLTGRLSGKASQAGKKKLALDADAELAKLEFKKHEITDVTGRLVKRSDSDVLQINKIAARAHDGKIDGEMTIRLAEPIHYELSASVYNIDLSKLVNVGQPDPKKWVKLNGMLSGRLSLEATGGEHPKQQASGELEISRGHMFQLPVILGFVNVVYLQLPSESAFNRGFVNYHMRNNVLHLDEIYLTGWDRKTKTGKGISILGSGKMNMKNEKLDLTFLTGPPGDLPRLDEITEDLLEALSRSLVEVHVTGTLKKPKMDTVPLSPLATIIRRLLEPSMKTQ